MIGTAQNNLVPNPGFESIIDCELDYGEADKAQPWKIINYPIATPDLFHYCATNSFFIPPVSRGCNTVDPKSGEGMAGLVNLGEEERIYARLLDELPTGTDIYVAYSILPSEKCGDEFELFCYTNTQSLAFSDVQFQSQVVVLESDTIFNYTQDWTLLQTCYQANGSEELVLLGNYKLTSETLADCDYVDANFNLAYFFVDDVIVAPFDVVPDTLFICDDEILNWDATFYEVPISWSDGWLGGIRTIEQPGNYTVMGDIGDCLLMDETLVIRITNEIETIEVDLCEGGELLLESPVVAVWVNGDTSTFLRVTSPGIYTATLFSSCGERQWLYSVEAKDCAIQYYVPNIFSPNRDGINDEAEFFFKSEFDFSGELSIYDRWGSLLFVAQNTSSLDHLSWDGRYRGELLNPGTYIWVYRYSSEADTKTARVISGDITIIR
jgi:gliding motility-associated-like protein